MRDIVMGEDEKEKGVEVTPLIYIPPSPPCDKGEVNLVRSGLTLPLP